MQANRYLALCIKIGLWAILFAPLLVSQNMFFPFITAKNFFFRIIIEIILTLWLILILRDKSYAPRHSWILIFATASAGVFALSTVFSVDASRSFWSNFERMEGLLGYLHVIAYFFILVGINKTEKDWWRFFHVSFLVSILVTVYALFQLAGVFNIHQGSVRLDATLGNATYLAVYMLFHLFLALYYFLKTKNVYAKISYLILFIFQTFIIFQTATRGAVIGFIGGILLFGILFAFISTERRWKYFAGGLVLFLFIAAGVFYSAKDSQFVKESPALSRLSNISIEDDDAQARLHIWRMSYEAFLERPILGWGPENFTVVFSKYFDPRLWAREPWFDRAHNVFFDWLIAGGIFGLASYLGIFAASFWLLIKKYREKIISNLELSVFAGLLGGFFFQNLFVFDQLTSYIMFFAVIGYINFISRAAQEAQKSVYLIPSGQAQVFSMVPVVLVLLALYFFNVKPLLANFSLISALENASKGNYEAAQDSFRRAINLSPLGRREAREQYAHFATLIAPEQKIPESIRVSSLTDAINESKLEVQNSPEDARSHLFLGTVYNASGRRTEALSSFEKALELSPKKQQIVFLVAQFYLDNGELDKAVELAKFGASLDPTYADAQRNLISIQIFAKKYDNALAAIENLIAKNSVGPDILKSWASLFAENKRYDEAVRLYLEALEISPSDTQMRINLAATYYESGKINLAIAQIQKAIEINPAFKAQGEEFIKQLRGGAKPQ